MEDGRGQDALFSILLGAPTTEPGDYGMPDISRRDFVALAAAGAVAAPFATTNLSARRSAAVTAQEIVDRLKKSVGVEWSADDVDTFKIGDPSTVVTGVVTTS